MIKISVVCVGKLKEEYWRKACAEYSKRMGRYADFSIIEIDEEKLPDEPSSAQIENTLKKEGERILAKIPKESRIISLCIEGRIYSSEELADMTKNIAIEGCSSIAFVIGGSWGLSEEVKKVSSVRMSMSRMTFPHPLARVMLCEQIYRSFQINSGGKYHK